MWENIVFFTFFERLSTKFAKMRKTAFFELFCATLSEKCEKTVFFFHVFRDTFYKVRKNLKKNSVFRAFCATFRNKFKKILIFHVFLDTLLKVRKKCAKQHFLSFLRDLPQKVWENSVISRFSRLFVQSSQKMQKTAFFERR